MLHLHNSSSFSPAVCDAQTESTNTYRGASTPTDLRERVCAGGEVALHKLGIHMRAVVSVEILDDVRAAMARS